MNELNEKCGVVGIFAPELDVARFAFFALFALQHRGQEASGITTSDGSTLFTHKGAGGGALDHAQPVVTPDATFALAHNGNIPSVVALQEFLKSKNALVSGRSDSELIADAVSVYLKEGNTLPDAVSKVFPLLTGAFALTMMTKDTLVAVRDSYGMRPLSLGSLAGGFVVASETCALKTIGATFMREVAPGEMLVINKEGLTSVKLAEPTPKHDIFEFVYFARPDSVIAGKLIYDVRKKFGETLARECPLEIDIVVPVPDTAMPVAIGYSQKSGVPLEMGLVKNRYVHRTFIEPDQKSREHSVALKLITLPEVLAGKRVAVIDDSVVRGTTSKRLIESLFKAGAKEVHFLVSSPPVKFPDFYGIDTPKQSDLIASHKTVEEIREFLGATSLHFLSLEGLIESIGIPADHLSTSFFTGEYPIDLLERKNEVTYNVPQN